MTPLLAQRSEKLKGRSRFWWPAGGMVTAALALAHSPTGDAIADDGRALDAARFADDALLELEDDAEFYAWLATVPDEDSATPLVEGSKEGWTL